MQVIANSNVTIINSNFMNGYALIGGAIYVLGDSSLNVYNTNFIENIAILNGGAIAAESFKTLLIANNTYFYKNEALTLTGDSIYCTGS